MQNPGNSPAESLAEEISVGTNLLQLLKQEQDFLINADLEGLTGVTEEKNKAVARMMELALSRHRTLAAAGLEASESGMQRWTEAAPAAVIQSWDQLIGIARQAKELNRTNGLLISQHMARNQNALNVLQGERPGGGMYGPNGQTATQSGRRTLVVG
ncbi:flagella synthesis protein FlgN [Noviherbaspirillum saxi]|uniref:Flagellar protein FlgN n=1 Tax=Noviherbaspirillum saxi TaxID=2320863 RepID=A0A3A3GCS2_9BURK|nr:flagellar protein FlgN [Noviherbaspirillum saxi]RJF98679.1 flagellar protein FlgN [Noviherbaspirillum saxi]